MQALGKNGVLVLSSVTGGDHKIEVPADAINLEFVLGNKVMVGTVNANREHFEMGVARHGARRGGPIPAGSRACSPTRSKGLDRYGELFDKLTAARGTPSRCSAR